MINYNGNLISKNDFHISPNNRAFKYGDGLFETMKIVNHKIRFCEDHYFRLMASMRMLRMEISMDLTLEFFETQIEKTVRSNSLSEARVRFSVSRKDGGYYLPKENTTDFLIEVTPLQIHQVENYEVDLFKDYYIYSGVLSTLKSTAKLVNVLASIFAQENELQNCLLLNEKKNLCEAINSNIFLVTNDKIVTPSLSEGCLKGVLRKKIIELLSKDRKYELEERAISPFELQKANEVFLTNSIVDIQSITKYRKKEYGSEVAEYLKEKLSSMAFN